MIPAGKLAELGLGEQNALLPHCGMIQLAFLTRYYILAMQGDSYRVLDNVTRM